MRESKVIGVLKEMISTWRRRGVSQVSITSLQAAIEKIAEDVSGVEGEQTGQSLTKEQFRAIHEAALAAEERQTAWDLEMFRSVITSGQGALRASLLISGGASVALLAFIGHLGTSAESRMMIPEFVLPMVFFAGGVLCSGLSHSLTYVIQYCFHHGRNKAGAFLNISTSLLVAAMYALFAVGCLSAYGAFVSIAQQ